MKRLAAFDDKLDAVRKQIVATTEGGAITGEERLREHTDQLYGAITSWDGPPSQYQLDNITALGMQLSEIETQFSTLTNSSLPGLNAALHAAGMEPLSVPAPSAVEDEGTPRGGGSVAGGGLDLDSRMGIQLPKNLRLWN